MLYLNPAIRACSNNMTDLATLYASGSVAALHCVSLENPALPGGGVHWVLQWFDPLVAKLETGAEQVFDPGWFDATLPEAGAVGQQQIQLSTSNVTGRIRRYIEDIRNLGGEVGVVYRTYVPGELDAPARVYRMTATQVSTKGSRATITAVFKDAVNARWPRITYTQDRFLGLAYFGG